jgi:hypothetical protein
MTVDTDNYNVTAELHRRLIQAQTRKAYFFWGGGGRRADILPIYISNLYYVKPSATRFPRFIPREKSLDVLRTVKSLATLRS